MTGGGLWRAIHIAEPAGASVVVGLSQLQFDAGRGSRGFAVGTQFGDTLGARRHRLECCDGTHRAITDIVELRRIGVRACAVGLGAEIGCIVRH